MRVRNQVLAQPVAVIADQVGNHSRPGAVIEETAAGANHSLLRLPRRVGEGKARGEIVVVVKIILPIVAHTRGNLKIRKHAKLILEESAQHVLDEYNVPISRLPQQRKRMVGIVLQSRKSISAEGVGVVVQSPAADVGNVDSRAEGVFGARPDQHLIEDDVILCLQLVRLRASPRERAQDHDLKTGTDTLGGDVFPRGQQPELVQQLLGQRTAVVEIDDVFAVLKICACLPKSEAAHPLVADCEIGIDATDRDEMILTNLMVYAAREFRVPLRRGDSVVNVSREIPRKDDGFWVLLFAIHRDQEGSLFDVAQGTGETALVDAALLRRADERKRVAGIQMVIAEDKVERAVIFRRAWLGDDLDAAAAWSGIFRRVRVLVELDLLNGGSGDALRHPRSV